MEPRRSNDPETGKPCVGWSWEALDPEENQRLNPCGRIMDARRSGGITPVRLYANSDRVSWIRWYKAAPGALPFPVHHAFASTIWEGDYDQVFQGPGAIDRTNIYATKHNRGYAGTCMPANLQWFQTGIPADPPPLTGVLCCSPTLTATGGAAISGTGYNPIPPIDVHVQPEVCGCGQTFWVSH